MSYNFWVISQPRRAIGQWNYSDINFHHSSLCVSWDTVALAFWRFSRWLRRREECNARTCSGGIGAFCSLWSQIMLVYRELDVFSNWAGSGVFLNGGGTKLLPIETSISVRYCERINSTHVRLCIELYSRELVFSNASSLVRRVLNEKQHGSKWPEIWNIY